MKTMIKKLVMPVAVLFIAITVALAGNSTSGEINSSDAKLGYKKIGTSCVPSSTICSSEFNEIPCTEGTLTLFDLNGTSCPDVLYIRMN